MPPRKAVPITLDKPRTLRITWLALEAAEQQLGLTVAALGEMMGDGSLRSIRTVVWLGLLHEDPELTLDAVGTLLAEADISVVLAAAGELAQQFGAAGKVEAAKPRRSRAKGSKPKAKKG